MSIPHRLHFLGLGFEKGQSKKGLVATAAKARGFFPLLPGIEWIDHGDLLLAHDSSSNTFFSEEQLAGVPWDAYSRAFHRSLDVSAGGESLLNWGGDHSVAISTVGAFLHRHDGYVLWIDAHADLNLPQASLSGYLHGMPLALLMNLQGVGERRLPWLTTFLDPSRLIYLGLRDLDPFEKTMIAALGIQHYSHVHLRERGMASIADEIRARTQGKPLHVSFDIDSVDPLFAPSTGVPVPGGLTPADFRVLGERLFSVSQVPSIDIVEVNPELGSAFDVARTYSVAFQFLNSVLQTSRGVYDRVGNGDDEVAFEPCTPFSTENSVVDRVRLLSLENSRVG